MKPSLFEVTVNGVPAGAFARFIWHKDGKYLLNLKRIDLSYDRALTAAAHYGYLLSIERHAGYTVLTVHFFGRSWLINIGKRHFYAQRIHQEIE